MTQLQFDEGLSIFVAEGPPVRPVYHCTDAAEDPLVVRFEYSRPHELVNAPRWLAWLLVVAGLIGLGLLLAGCSAVTHEQLVDLDESIRHERKATVARPGFEGEVAALRSATDAFIAAALKATSR